MKIKNMDMVRKVIMDVEWVIMGTHRLFALLGNDVHGFTT